MPVCSPQARSGFLPVSRRWARGVWPSVWMILILYEVFSASVQSPLCRPLIHLTNIVKIEGPDEGESTLTSSSVLVLETIKLLWWSCPIGVFAVQCDTYINLSSTLFHRFSDSLAINLCSVPLRCSKSTARLLGGAIFTELAVVVPRVGNCS